MRYKVLYGERQLGDTKRYVVSNGTDREQFDSKVDAIKASQSLNGYTPVDGSESTYGRQIAGRR